MTEKSGENFKCLDNEKSFYNKIKSIFHHFNRLSLTKKNIFFLKWQSDVKGFHVTLQGFSQIHGNWNACTGKKEVSSSSNELRGEAWSLSYSFVTSV